MNLAAQPQFPTKWPFPPAPPARRAWERVLSPFRPARWKATNAAASSPAPSVPPSPYAFPATAAATSDFTSDVTPAVRAAISADSIATAAVSGAGRDVTVRQMVVDILLVAMWGAMIPALMWLGAAAGF